LDMTVPLTFGHARLAAIRPCLRLLMIAQAAATANSTKAPMSMIWLSLILRA
jgi:hypothetical protein